MGRYAYSGRHRFGQPGLVWYSAGTPKPRLVRTTWRAWVLSFVSRRPLAASVPSAASTSIRTASPRSSAAGTRAAHLTRAA